MVKAALKKVFIKNFKSLHDCEIDIGKLNVVVGANASGKSNLVEAFRLLKKIYVEKDINPFSEWWGYNNAVWQRKEELSITIGLLFDIEGYEVYFEIICMGAGGKFQILREVLDVKGYVRFDKEGEWMAITHNPDFIDDVIKNPLKYEASPKARAKLKKIKSRLTKEIRYQVDLEIRLLEYSFFYPLSSVKVRRRSRNQGRSTIYLWNFIIRTNVRRPLLVFQKSSNPFPKVN